MVLQKSIGDFTADNSSIIRSIKMKLLALILIGQAIVVQCSPILNEDGVKAKASTVSKITPEGKISAASAEASARLFKREEPVPVACPKPDYKLIQEKVTIALNKAVEKFAREQLRKKRDASSSASSEVGPGGKTKSSANAMRTPDAPFIPAPIQPQPAEDQFPLGYFRRPVSGQTNIAGGDGPAPVLPAVPSDQVPSVPVPSGPVPSGPVPSGPVPSDPVPSGPVDSTPVVTPGHTKGKIQNVKATANMETGTAIAAASKRSADIQTVHASGNKAIASAKNKPSGNGLSLQKVEATGGEFAKASAESGPEPDVPVPVVPLRDDGHPIVKRDSNHQNVKASGNTAIASAKNHKAGDINTQTVVADGGKLAVATASDSSDPVPVIPDLPEPQQVQPGLPANLAPIPHKRATDTTIQVVKASGDKAISSASSDSHGVSTFQDVESKGNNLAVATANTKSKRSSCNFSYDDALKSIISKAVADAFVEIKF